MQALKCVGVLLATARTTKEQNLGHSSSRDFDFGRGRLGDAPCSRGLGTPSPVSPEDSRIIVGTATDLVEASFLPWPLLRSRNSVAVSSPTRSVEGEDRQPRERSLLEDQVRRSRDFDAPTLRDDRIDPMESP